MIQQVWQVIDSGKVDIEDTMDVVKGREFLVNDID